MPLFIIWLLDWDDMAYDRFLIAQYPGAGVQKDVEPWLIPDEAFASLKNAYVWRGRVRKRFGSRLMNSRFNSKQSPLRSRLRLQVLDNQVTPALVSTDASGNVSVTLNSSYTFAVGQAFSVANEFFTIVATSGSMLTNGAATVATFDTSSRALVITGATPLTPVYWYPCLPVMGLLSKETAALENNDLYAFDTRYAYTYLNGAFTQLGTAQWTGTNSDFFWGTNWRGVYASDTRFFVSNYVEADGIRYYDPGASDWVTMDVNTSSVTDGSGNHPRVVTARIVIPFKNRLILLNTIEYVVVSSGQTVLGKQTFVNRCRFSQIGSPFDAEAWYEPPGMYGRGGWLDAPTQEPIVSCQIIKDRLIVYFANSTYELVYIGNQNQPFIWQTINSELGCESTFSTIPFDKAVLGIGSVGVHACNGINVDRIDQKIPDEVFQIYNGNNGPYRVYGIRDYYTEAAYWAFPSADVATTYPNRVMVYNYQNQTWAFNDDSITCFGYFNVPDDITWEDATMTWEEADFPWNSASLQAEFQTIIGGNQQGFVFVIDRDIERNSASLQITNMTYNATTTKLTVTAYSHNLQSNDYVLLEGISTVGNTGTMLGLEFTIYPVTVVDSNTFTIVPDFSITGTYAGGATLARVSNIDIQTKQFNPYNQTDRNVYIAKVDFLVDRTDDGEITVDYWPSSSNLSMVQAGSATGSIMGTSVLETSPFDLYPLEFQQERLWHPVYFQVDGECIQFHISFSPAQMKLASVSLADFQLHAITLYAQPTSRMQ